MDDLETHLGVMHRPEAEPVQAMQEDAHSFAQMDAADTTVTHDTEEAKPVADIPEAINAVGNHVKGNSSSVGESDSDYLPDAQGDVDSDDDILTSQTKKSRKRRIKEHRYSELHAKWERWESMFSELKLKQQAGTLTRSEKDDFERSRAILEGVVEELPADDTFQEEYAECLASCSSPPVPHKRKSGGATTGRSKKARRTNSAANSASGTLQLEATKLLMGEQVKNELQKFKDRAMQTNPDLELKRLTSEVSDLQFSADKVGDKLAQAGSNAWLIRGMKTPLYDYQFCGVGWALRRERCKKSTSEYNPKGGILADEMGCGKTITMLALMMANPAPKSPRYCKANLLVVQSNQMVDQWASQIKRHCEAESMATTRWSRTGTLNNAALSSEQVVTITFNELERAWKRLTAAKEKAPSAGGEGSDVKDSLDQEKLLFKRTFHRLILDECQLIKNHNGSTARAVFNLKSNIQWLISATPAPNNEDEYYSYLKILKLSFTETVRAFKQYWKSPADNHSRAAKVNEKPRTHLEAGLDHFQLCRNHRTKLAGVPIFDDVPNSIYSEALLTLSDDERALYNIVVAPLCRELVKRREQRAKGELEAIEDGEKSTGNYIVSKMLQLYKLTAHPFLLETVVHHKDFTLEQRLEVRQAVKRRNKPIFVQLGGLADEVEENSLASPSASSGSQLASQPSPIPPDVAMESKDLSMDQQLDFNLGELGREGMCDMCGKQELIPTEAITTECNHRFCQKHFDKILKVARLESSHVVTCMVCEADIGHTEKVDQTELSAAYEVYKAAAIAQRPKGRGHKPAQTNGTEKKRGDDSNGYQPKGAGAPCKWLELSDKSHPTTPLSHSAKTREILKIVLGWKEDAPDDKIVIFTQWTTMARIVGRHLEDAEIKFLYYFGEMSTTERSKNLQNFEARKDIPVIIMGLRCAGQGLDMHYANRVILVDPWFNEDGERQAFARVLRKVQKKKTFFVRLMADKSIDMRIREIQTWKREMTEALKKEYDPLRRQEIEQKYEDKYAKFVLGENTDDK